MRWSGLLTQRMAAIALVSLSIVFVVARCAAPGTPFLVGHSGADCIMAPEPVNARLHQWGSDSIPRVQFSAPLPGTADAEVAPGRTASGSLRVRAFGRVEVSLAGTPLSAMGDTPARGPGDELRFHVPAGVMHSGGVIEVDVRNPRGPALLWARLDVDDPSGVVRIATDPTWRARIYGGVADGVAGPALIADDTRPNPASHGGVAPARAFGRERDTLLAVFVLAGLACLALWRSDSLAASRLPPIALGLVVVVWLVYLARFLEVPFEVGFDARNHQAYVDYLREQRQLPLATDGWSMFHPPLFHVAAALLQALAEAAGAAESALARRAIGFASGLVSVLAVFGLLRALFPERFGVQAWGLVFAALLPVHVYSAAYFSNEPLHTALATLSVYGVVRALMLPSISARAASSIGALLGLALLAKFTSAVLAGLAPLFLGLKMWVVEGRGRADVARTLAALVGPVVVLAGWYYLRNAWLLGDPFMTNWDDVPGSGRSWWQQPGFHTPAYFTQFGASLSQPFLSGFESFWDSVYSTFWGDGLVAGRVNPAQRHSVWNYDYMALSYWAGLPATGLLGWGVVRAVGVAFADSDPRRRLALSFLLTLSWAVAVAFVVLALEAPFYSQVKATYGLVLLGPLSVYFGLGCEACDAALAARGHGSRRALRVAFHATLATSAFVFIRTFAG